MKLVKIVMVGLLPISLFGQTNEAVMAKYASTVTKADLRKHLEVLASDEFEGRETGMKGQRMAAEYIQKQFLAAGLKAVVNGNFQQEFPITIEKAGNSGLSINGKSYEFLNDFFYVGSFKEGSINVSDVCFVGYGIETDGYNDYAGIDVKGKVVAFLEGQPKDKKGVDIIKGENAASWSMDRTKKTKLAIEKGAVGILVISAEYDKKVAQFKSFILSPRIKLKRAVEQDKKAAAPTFYISETAGYEIVKTKWAGIQDVKEKIAKTKKPVKGVFPASVEIAIRKDIEEGTSSNVLGYVEGTDLKDELLVISAHYDHIGMSGGKVFNGADDDGSGTVAVIELAEAFAKAKADGNGPRRSILFMTVSGEEKGLLGSEYYTDFPIFPLANTVCDLNIDMIGRQDKKYEADPNYVYVIGSDKLSSDLHNISEEANKKFGGLTLDYTYNAPNDPNRFYYRSDHYNFAKNNIPVIFYFNGVHEDYHKETDEVAKINFDKMEKISRLIFYTAWEVANRNDRLKVDKVNDFKN